PSAFQGDRVDVAGDQQIVAEHDCVAALFGGPAVRPGPPGPVAAEAGQQLVVVAGQVVLGEEVDLEGGPGHAGEPRLVRGPGLGGEVAAQPPGDVRVGHTAFGHGQMPVKQPLATGSNSRRRSVSGWRSGTPASLRGQAVSTGARLGRSGQWVVVVVVVVTSGGGCSPGSSGGGCETGVWSVPVVGSGLR